jgi:hypothetical protein
MTHWFWYREDNNHFLFRGSKNLLLTVLCSIPTGINSHCIPHQNGLEPLHYRTKDLELKTREWSSTKQVIFVILNNIIISSFPFKYEILFIICLSSSSILFQVLFFKIVVWVSNCINIRCDRIFFVWSISLNWCRTAISSWSFDDISLKSTESTDQDDRTIIIIFIAL